MKILIFEGIATSGKSTVINGLIKSLPPYVTSRVFTEQFTHVPIMEKTSELFNEFFIKLISEAVASDYDILLFDRLYLTQAFRAKSKLDKYLDVEMLLFTNLTTTIFLKVEEPEIAKRVSSAIKYRDPEWGKYVGTKGQTLNEQAEYYIEQQRSQLELLKQSKLPYEIYDTTNLDYKSIINKIKDKILAGL